MDLIKSDKVAWLPARGGVTRCFSRWPNALAASLGITNSLLYFRMSGTSEATLVVNCTQSCCRETATRTRDERVGRMGTEIGKTSAISRVGFI